MNVVTRWFRLTKANVSSGTRGIVLAVSTPVLGMLALAAPASATTVTFNYTGAAQTWTVPAQVTEATFDLYGAQGGTACCAPPGLGGRTTATIPVTPGASIEVYVGGQGVGPASSAGPAIGGFNGGGDGSQNGGSGGGASDIRVGGTALTDRVLVAGGGGGAASGICENGNGAGGDGGGLSGVGGGDSGCGGDAAGGGGGTQTAGGSAGTGQAGQFGVGASAGPFTGAGGGGGGGGGWYGGGAGVIGGGGGGSGHGPPGTVFQTGVHSGNGLVTITVPSIADLIDRVTDLNLPPALKSSLLQKLNAAQTNPAQACNELAAFISQVARGESRGKIPGADADQLIDEAEHVRESLGCDAALGSCAGREATIVGTKRSDKLRGTNGDDVIAAGGGADRVVGLKGDDLICASGGADVLRGKGGDDTLRGGGGKDQLRGGGGSNRCRGGKGSDRKHHC